MNLALNQAMINLGNTKDNPSVGCIITKNNAVISSGFTSFNGRPHAEDNAICDRKGNLIRSNLYVTLEPCVMCGGASYWTQIKRIVYGTSDEKRGFSNIKDRVLHPKTEVTKGLLNKKCSKILQEFFRKKRT